MIAKRPCPPLGTERLRFNERPEPLLAVLTVFGRDEAAHEEAAPLCAAATASDGVRNSSRHLLTQ
eukprot:2813905-Pleurochrysis_carterae.AAC.1